MASLPPVGTTTATSIGRNYTLGATRSLESPGGKAERLARRYIRKFGDAGARAAAELLQGAAAAKLGTSAVTPQALVGERDRVQTEMMRSAFNRAKDMQNEGDGQEGQPNRGGNVSTLDTYFRSPEERDKEIEDRRKRMKEEADRRMGTTASKQPAGGSVVGAVSGAVEKMKDGFTTGSIA